MIVSWFHRIRLRAGVAVGLSWLAAGLVVADDRETPDGARDAVADDASPGDRIARLEAVVSATPEAAEAWRDLGWTYWELGRLDQTRRVWQTWRRLEPRRAEVHALMGRLELAEDRLTEAVAAFRESLTLDPALPEIEFNLARTLRWTGHLDEAIVRLRRLYDEQPDDHEIRLELARALSSNWQYSEALPLWSDLRAARPDDLDIRLSEALAALHTGSSASAVLDARRVLHVEPDNLRALTILADEAEFNQRPEEAVGWIERLIEVTPDGADRNFLRGRLLAVLRRIGDRDPTAGGWARQIALARENLAAQPLTADAHLVLAELLLQQGQFDDVTEILWRVLREFNPRYNRVWLMLFETALARQRLAEAADALEQLRAFHPLDPYLAWYEARWHAAAGDPDAAEKALDRLADAGDRGATALLLYHALTPGDYGPALSVNRFREHVRALLAAGYTVITAEQIHDDWERHGQRAGRGAAGRLRRVVALTFDDALESAMRFGTDVGLDYGLRFSQYVPVGNIERGDPYIATWDQLNRYGESGVWEYGSHLVFGSDRYRMFADGPAGAPIALRQWLPVAERHETESEYFVRLRHEYDHGAEQIRHHLGQPCRVVAYPYGDIGQEGASNMPDAIPVNLRHAARHHDIGFIQTRFAHAVRGANPLLYGRHEMDIHWTGEQVVQYLIDRHPVILAERTRLEMALWQGRPAAARRALRRLAAAGYPRAAWRRLEQQLPAALAPVFAMPDAALVADGDAATERAWRADMDLQWFEDNIDARHIRVAADGTVGLGSGWHLAVRAGGGQISQGRRSPPADDQRVDLTEMLTQLELATVDSRHWAWTIMGGWRRWRGDDERERGEAAVSVRGRVAPALAVRLGWFADAPPQARVLARGLTWNRLQGEAYWEPFDDGRLHLDGEWQHLSDGNRVLIVNLSPVYAPSAWRGASLGLRLAHRASDRETVDLWTPRRMHGLYAVAGQRGRLAGGAYDLRLQTGLSRETGFAGRETDDGPVAEADSGDWQAAYGLSAGWSRDRNGRRTGVMLGWNRGAAYEETRVNLYGGIRF